MLIPSLVFVLSIGVSSLSRRVNANSQLKEVSILIELKLIKKGEC